MEKGLISIICPIYNSETFLKECLVSVTKQTDSEWELILIDDGSTDTSSLICDEFSKKDKRIKTIHKNNEGQMKARIDGIKYSSGDYIMFLDSDDKLAIDSIKTIRANLALFPNCDCFLFNADIFPTDRNTKSIPQVRNQIFLNTNDEVIQYTFGYQMFGYLWMYCFKKEIILNSLERDNLFLSVRYTEDGAFIFNAILGTKSLCAITDCLYAYRNNETSITHHLTNKDRRDRYLVFNHIYSNIFDKYNQFVLSNQNAEMISWALFSLLEHIVDKNDYKKMFKEARDSAIFKRICRKVKTKNKRFKIYKFLLGLNLPNIFYKFSHK